MNEQDLLITRNVKDKDLSFEDTSIVKINRSKLGYFSAITLPLILAACGGGGGGGGGAVSPTPAPGRRRHSTSTRGTPCHRCWSHRSSRGSRPRTNMTARKSRCWTCRRCRLHHHRRSAALRHKRRRGRPSLQQTSRSSGIGSWASIRTSCPELPPRAAV